MRIAAWWGVAILVGTSAPFARLANAQQPAPPAPPAPALATQDTSTTPLPVPTELTQVRPGGLTAGQVGARAAATSWSAKAYEESLRGAAARVDEAWAAFLPRLSGIGKYTRLSNFTVPSFFNVPGGLVATPEPTGTLNPTPTISASIPPITFFKLDNWLLEATLTIPISDYFLRIDQNYTAATHSQDAARWDVIGARASSWANGAAAYYTWLRARGAVVVAVQALNDQKTHLRDARNQFAAGNASKADVLRAETAVASAELTLERAKNLADLSEKQLRVAIHARDEESIVPGEDLEITP
jgi:outer membrane protein